MRFHPAACVFVAVALAACGAITGADDLRVRADDADGGITDGPDGQSPTDGGSTPDGGGTPDGDDPPLRELDSGPEDCTNGIDDDNDGLVDCADPKCIAIGYGCRVVPAGWQGPYAVYSGTNPPACAAPFPAVGIEGKDALQVPPASCSCSCGAITGDGCAGSLEMKSSCSSGSTTSVQLSLTCTAITQVGTGVSSNGGSGTSGSCTGSAGPQAPTSWNRSVRACRIEAQLPAGGCAAPALCAPAPPAAFAKSHCVTHDGDLACPAGFPTKSVAYLGVTDNRRCDGCGCSAPPCPTKVTAYGNSGCTGFAFSPSSSCNNFTPMKSARIGDGSPRSCTVVNGTPTGTAVPSQPFTVCCSN